MTMLMVEQNAEMALVAREPGGRDSDRLGSADRRVPSDLRTDDRLRAAYLGGG